MRAFGTISITDIQDGERGVGIQQTVVNYCVSSNGNTPPGSPLVDGSGNIIVDLENKPLTDGAWQTTIPSSIPQGYYLWTRTVITYESGEFIIVYNVSRNGEQGISITGQKEQWYLSTSNSALAGGTWSYEEPDEIPDGKYLWGRWEFTMSDSTKQYSDAVHRSVISGVINMTDEINGKITQKVWQTDIDNTIGEYDSNTTQGIRDRVTQTETDINGINTTISNIQSTVSGKADSSSVTTLASQVNTISDTVSGHTQTIGQMQTTIESKADGSALTSLAQTVATNEQTASSFRQTVESTYATSTSVDSKIANIKIGGNNLYVIQDEVEGYLNSNNSGSISATSAPQNAVTSSFIVVKEGETYVIQSWATPNAAGESWLGYQFFSNNSGTPLGDRVAKYGKTSGSGVETTAEGMERLEYIVTVPTGGKYLRVSYRSFADGRCMVERATKPSEYSMNIRDYEAYTDTAVSTAKSEIKQTTDNISLEVSNKVGNNEIISKINQSPENITISASKVDLVGHVTFNMLDSNAQGRITGVETAVSQAQDDIDNLQVGGRNLMINTLNPDVSSADKRPKMLWQDVNTTVNGSVTTAEHGFRTTVTSASRPAIYFGYHSSDPFGLNGFILGETYTLSFDAKWKQMSSYTGTGTSYIRAYLYDDKDTTGTVDLDAYVTFCTLTSGNFGTEMTGRCEFTFTIPQNVTKAYIVIRCSNGTASNYASGDYIELRNIKLEKGNKATDWSPAPEDYGMYMDSIENGLNDKIDNISIGGRNMLLDSNAPTLTKVASSANRYWSNSTVTSVVPELVEVTDAPYNITTVARFTCDGTNSNHRALTFYGGTTNANPKLIDGEEYTVSVIARLISGSTGNIRITYGNSPYVYINDHDITSTEWTVISDSFIYDAEGSNSGASNNDFGPRIYFYAENINGSPYVIEMCGFKLERGNKATDWTPAPEDIDYDIQYANTLIAENIEYTDIINEKSTPGLGMKVNYSAFSTPDGGECYLHGYTDGVAADVDGYVYWNDKKYTVPKKMINPGSVLPFYKTAFIVLRLSSATADTGTIYLVWYDTAWKYSIASPSSSGNWTWDEDIDIVLGQFIPTAAEGQIIDAYLYNPPRNASSIMSTGNNAYGYSQAAVNWVNTNGATTTSATDMIKVWTGGAISQTTEILGGWIKTHTITSDQLATDAVMSNNYQASGNTSSPYSTAGTFLDLANGNFYTPNFGLINTTPTGTTIPTGAFINGTLIGSAGRFGNDTSYWNIETVYDYNMQPHAALVGTGSPYLQTGNWQISDNTVATRKYTSTNTTSGRADYYKETTSNTYYDVGMKIPTVWELNSDTLVERYNRSFYYMRKYTGNSIPSFDSDWTYPFMVDSEGRVYATDIIITGGTSSTYLPLTGGTISGNLTVQGTLTATASKAAQLNHSISINGTAFDGLADVNVGVIGAAYGGTGQNTLQKSANALINALSNGSNTPVDNDYYVSQYVGGGTTTTTYHRRPMSALWNYVKGKIDSVYDISGTYRPLSNNEFDYAIIDELTAGDLVVTGSGRFTNTIYGNLNGNVTGNLSGTATQVSNNLTITLNGGTTEDTNQFTYNGSSAKSIDITPSNIGAIPSIGGTFTGNIVIENTSTIASNTSARISFRNIQTDNNVSTQTAYIATYDDHDASASGQNMIIRPGGNLFAGGGESASVLYNTIGIDSAGERLFLTADTNIYIEAKCNTISDRIGVAVTTNHNLVPIAAEDFTDNIGSIGTSAYRWANVYATTLHGKLDSRTITIGNTGKSVDWSTDVSWTKAEISGDATTSASGWMSKDDKSKLDAINVSNISDVISASTIIGSNGISVTVTEQGVATVKHANSAITAGTASGTATSTLTNGGSFNIPTVTYDAYGHITAKGTTTLTLPNITSVTGNAGTATKFSSARSITLTGDTTGTASSDGENGWSIATTTSVLHGTSGSNTTTGSAAIIAPPKTLGIEFHPYIAKASTGLFPASNNANSILTISRYLQTNHSSQLGFSSDGNIYYRSFTSAEIDATTSWDCILSSANYNSYSPTLTGTGASGTWGIDISGTAAQATADGSGNTISSTYAKLASPTFTGTVSAPTFSASTSVNVNSGNSGTTGGIALYGTDPSLYGIAMRLNTDLGSHGFVTSWATFFNMRGSNSTNIVDRGWIFRDATNERGVASISGEGNAVFNGSITVGGNTNNTSGAKMVFNESLQCIDFIFN